MKTLWINIFLSALLVGLVFLSQKSRLNLPFTENEGMFTCAAQEMVDYGSKLYKDVWDHKPPLFFLQGALIHHFFPLDELHVHLYVIFVHLINAFLILYLFQKLRPLSKYYWAAPFLYAFLIFPPIFQPWTPQSNLLMTPFLLLSFWLGFSNNKAGAFFSGFCWGIAFFTNQTALFYLPVYIVLFGIKDLAKLAFFIIGMDVISGLVALPFYLDGRIQLFWQAIIGFNLGYVNSGWWLFFHLSPLRHVIFTFHEFVFLIYGLPIALCIYSIRHKPGYRGNVFLIFWVIGSLFSVLTSGHFFCYYYLALLPPMSVALGFLFTDLEPSKKYFLIFCVPFSAVWIFFFQLNGFSVDYKLLPWSQYNLKGNQTAREMGIFIKGDARPGDRLLSWTGEPQVYTYSGLKMGVVKTPMINQMANLGDEIKGAEEGMTKNSPEYCLTSQNEMILPVPKWLETVISEKYEPVKNVDNLTLFKLKNI